MLSRGQFGKLANTVRSGGGFSVDVHTGKSPETGFMVAANGSPELQRPAPSTYGTHLQAYAQAHKGALSQKGHYMGAWGGKYYATLDVSQNIPHKPEVAKQYGTAVAHADARTSALDLLYARNEKAAYDLNKKNPDGSVGADLPNPSYDAKRPKDKRK